MELMRTKIVNCFLPRYSCRKRFIPRKYKHKLYLYVCRDPDTEINRTPTFALKNLLNTLIDLWISYEDVQYV